jgi:hypothetical protein
MGDVLALIQLKGGERNICPLLSGLEVERSGPLAAVTGPELAAEPEREEMVVIPGECASKRVV